MASREEGSKDEGGTKMVPLNRKKGKGKDHSFVIAGVLGPAREKLHPIGHPQIPAD